MAVCHAIASTWCKGDPGSGKTTLALQFLLDGVRTGESVFYITLSETEAELRKVAHSHGWSLDAIPLLELSAIESLLRPEAQTTVFHPSEVELNKILMQIATQSDFAPSNGLNRITVLAVDDDEDTSGGKVITANSGAEALELAKDSDFDISDISMPGMDGLSLCDASARYPIKKTFGWLRLPGLDGRRTSSKLAMKGLSLTSPNRWMVKAC